MKQIIILMLIFSTIILGCSLENNDQKKEMLDLEEEKTQNLKEQRPKEEIKKVPENINSAEIEKKRQQRPILDTDIPIDSDNLNRQGMMEQMQQMLKEACNDKNKDDFCILNTPMGEREGTCQIKDEDLICMPNR